jgi:hypothetical protein
MSDNDEVEDDISGSSKPLNWFEQLKQSDFDSPWKEALELYFPECMEFFFPEAERHIDWSAGYEFLDKELQQIVRDAEVGKRFADKLVRVRLMRSGEEAWILVHVEVQGHHETAFAERMFVYNYRLFDRYKRAVASFAILTDESRAWRPHEYSYSALGSEMRFRFAFTKMLDFADDWDWLETSMNPFAIVVMAHLKVLATKGKMPERAEWKLRIATELYRKDYTKQQVLELLRFIDWLITLPETLQIEYQNNVHLLEETKMRYLSSFEMDAIERGWNKGLKDGREQGIEQGIEQGLEKGQKQALRNIATIGLRKRFGEEAAPMLPRIEQITDIERLQAITEALFTASSIDDIQQLMNA